jgi:hypothetical protein
VGIAGNVNAFANPIFQYDPNGNLTCMTSAGDTGCTTHNRTVAYTASSMTETLTQAVTSATPAASYALTYDLEHNRLMQLQPNLVRTYYLNDPVSNVMTERYTVGAVTTWRSYFVVDGKAVAERFSSGSTVTMQNFVLDHLGSLAAIAAINPTTGAVTPTWQAYDAWGKMRVATTGADGVAKLGTRLFSIISCTRASNFASASRFSTRYSCRS